MTNYKNKYIKFFKEELDTISYTENFCYYINRWCTESLHDFLSEEEACIRRLCLMPHNKTKRKTTFNFKINCDDGTENLDIDARVEKTENYFIISFSIFCCDVSFKVYPQFDDKSSKFINDIKLEFKLDEKNFYSIEFFNRRTLEQKFVDAQILMYEDNMHKLAYVQDYTHKGCVTSENFFIKKHNLLFESASDKNHVDNIKCIKIKSPHSVYKFSICSEPNFFEAYDSRGNLIDVKKGDKYYEFIEFYAIHNMIATNNFFVKFIKYASAIYYNYNFMPTSDFLMNEANMHYKEDYKLVWSNTKQSEKNN